ncbi:MAG: glycyl-radical enzyme activating protein [Oligoflexia bacterium]|nr:glycyl-radical enzyme activating protein [Oligoflexia bacterium]
MKDSIKGNIFNIQKFSVHDGPGIRTLVFFKGCPLSCIWCSNPEGLDPIKPALQFSKDYCSLCGRCVHACSKQNAHKIVENEHQIERKDCIGCNSCVEACPNIALKLASKEMSVDEVLALVMQDKVFYETSGGGITLGGGDPLMQADFAANLLMRCKQSENKINTAIETSGCVSWKEWEKILPYLDLAFVDIKHMDEEQHKKYTGVDNKRILENICKLLSTKTSTTTSSSISIIIRIPLIPDFNTDEENAKKCAEFLQKHDVQKTLKYVELLPYHEWGVMKYQQLGLSYNGPKEKIVTKETMEKIALIFKEHLIQVVY